MPESLVFPFQNLYLVSLHMHGNESWHPLYMHVTFAYITIKDVAKNISKIGAMKLFLRQFNRLNRAKSCAYNNK